MKYLVIDRRVVRNNLKAIKERADGAAIYVDLSANASGMGLLEIAKLLRDDGIHNYVISDPKDAAYLRNNGFTEEKLMMLRSTADQEELAELIDLKVICTVGSYDAAVAANGTAEARKTIAEVQIVIDTGFGRYGFQPAETDKIGAIYKYMSNLVVVGTFTTYAASWRNRKLTEQQFHTFDEVLDKITEMGYEPGVAHACDSAALFKYDFGRMDAVRVDSALTGRIPGKNVGGLGKVGYIEAGIEELNWFPKGHRVGAERGVIMKKPTRIAVLSVGYYHGFSVDRPNSEQGLLDYIRRCRSKRFVRINGQKVRVIGDVGMLHTTVDVTNIECAVGESAILDVDPVNVKGLPVLYI